MMAAIRPKERDLDPDARHEIEIVVVRDLHSQRFHVEALRRVEVLGLEREVADPELAGSIPEVVIGLRVGRVGGRPIDDLDGEAIRVRRPEHSRRTARLRILVARPLGADPDRIDSILQAFETVNDRVDLRHERSSSIRR